MSAVAIAGQRGVAFATLRSVALLAGRPAEPGWCHGHPDSRPQGCRHGYL